MKFQTDCLSETGGRKKNQDRAGSDEVGRDMACWVVADGLGGHWGGEEAAQIAVDQILHAFKARPEVSAEALRFYLETAHQAILNAQESDPELARMRTTAVVLVSDSRQALWAHVGDSRLYFFRDGAVAFYTKDHSVPQVLVNTGEISPGEVRYHPDRSKLLRALGAEGEFNPTIAQAPQPLQHGDAFLMCSDGFWEYVWEEEMEESLQAAPEDPVTWLEYMKPRVDERAEEGHDNYTAMAVIAQGAPDFAAAGGGLYEAEPPTEEPLRRGAAAAAPQSVWLKNRQSFIALAGILVLIGGFIIARGVFKTLSSRSNTAESQIAEADPQRVIVPTQDPTDPSPPETPTAPDRSSLEDTEEDELKEPAASDAAAPPDVAAASETPTDDAPTHRTSFGMVLHRIEAGEFRMGYDGARSESDERPVHTVRLTRPFYLGVHEVTQEEWRAVMGRGSRPWEKSPKVPRDDDYPATFVSWDEVQTFLERLNEQEGGGYRLPTEAEWEYACRAGATTKYYYGDEERLLKQYAWYKTNTAERLQPVGGKKPNAWGLHDMHGNAAEWVNDWYDEEYYQRSTMVDPTGPSRGRKRVYRGGSVAYTDNGLRASYRNNGLTTKKSFQLGFRIARDAR